MLNAIRNAVKEKVEAEAKEFETDPEGDPLQGKDVFKALAGNEDGDAWFFWEIYENRFTFDHAAADWFVFNGHHWQEDLTGEVTAALSEVVNLYATEANRQGWQATSATKQGDKAAAESAESRRKELLKRVRDLQTAKRKRDVLFLAAAGHGLTGNEWDREPMLLACRNGVIDLLTGKYRAGRPEDFIKTAAPTEWRGLDEAAPTWERFLFEVFHKDAELISYIARLLGYGVTGSTEHHVIPVFWGAGRNGKGTLLEAIKAVLGDYALKAEAELLLEQKFARSSGAPNSAVLSLRGKRLVFVSETDEGRKLNASRVKELCGGDTLNARGVHAKRHVEFKPSHLLLLMTNNRPKAPAGDFALWQRIHLIPFTQSFIDAPSRPNEHQADPKLPEKLQAEASGILAWLVRGCLAWQREGLNPPETVKAATEEYRRAEDIIQHFLDDTCLIADHAGVKAGELYKAYQVWCEENGHKPLSGTRFGRDIKDRFDSYQDYKGVFYVGIGIKT